MDASEVKAIDDLIQQHIEMHESLRNHETPSDVIRIGDIFQINGRTALEIIVLGGGLFIAFVLIIKSIGLI